MLQGDIRKEYFVKSYCPSTTYAKKWRRGCLPSLYLYHTQICHKQGLLNSGMSHTPAVSLNKLIAQNGTFWRFRASWCHQMPPALTLLFKLIFPCMETQAQENNKVKYTSKSQNPVLLQKNKSSVKYATRLRTASIKPVYEFARKQRFKRDRIRRMSQYPAGQ